MSQPYPPPYPSQPSPYPQQSWSDPRAAVPDPTHLGSWTPQPAAAPYPGPGYGGQQYGGHHQPYGPQGPAGPTGPENGMGITALVLALVGLGLCWIPFVGLLSILLGALAIVFGLVGWNRARQGRAGLALPVAGAAIGIVAIVVAVLSTVVVTRLFVPADTADAQPAVSSGATTPDLPAGSPPAPGGPEDAPAPSGDGIVAAPGEYTWEDGLTVRVSAPTPAEFSDTACCPETDGTGVAFEVTIVNGTSEVLEPYDLLATLTADGRPANQVFDTAGGFDGISASVPPGRELVVPMAFDATGGDLLLEMMSFDRGSAFFSATL